MEIKDEKATKRLLLHAHHLYRGTSKKPVS
jgi:hypothetical protein